jgi:hypothetical protein
MKRLKLKTAFAITAGMLALAPALRAQVISWQYDYYGTFSGGSSYAGVVSVPFWNDSYLQGFPSAASRTNLLDSTGATVPDFSFTTSVTGGWFIQGSTPTPDVDGTYNKLMLNGYLNANNAQSITLNGIPYAQYSLYVYLSADVAGRNGAVSIDTTTNYFATLGPTANNDVNAQFIQTTDTAQTYPSANYAVFTGLTNSSQVVRWSIPQWGGIAGFQIVATAETPVSIITQPPAATTWIQNTPNSLTVSATGAPIYYQWRTNGVNIPGATNVTFSVPLAQASHAGTYSVRVYNNISSQISSNAVVTYQADTTAPTLAGVHSYDGISVGVKFSEALNSGSAVNLANYSISAGSVAAATLMNDGKSVALTLSAPISGQFVVTVNNAQDLSGNSVTANSTGTNTVLNLQFADFSTFQAVSASYTGHIATIVAGGADIWSTADTFDFAYLNVTNDFDYRARILSLTDGGGGTFTRAGIMVRDDLDTTWGGTHQASMVWNYGNLFQHLYRGTIGGTTTDDGFTSAGFGTNSWVRLARSGNIFRGYYSSNGVDWVQHMQIDGSVIGDAMFTNSVLYLGVAVCAHSASAITTAEVADFGPTPPKAVSITTQPVASATWLQGTAHSLSVVADGYPLFYQWRTNGVNISGATNATYSRASVALTDAATYTVLVYNSISSVLSSSAVISVSNDTNAPFVNRVISYDGNTVWIEFSEPMNGTTATNLAFYSVAGSTVTNAVFGADGKSVTLYLSAPVGSYATVTITGVKDAIGNTGSGLLGSVATGMQVTAFGNATNLNAAATFAGNTIVAEGGGSDVWLDSDNFALVHYPAPITGAFDYRMRVHSVPDAYGGDSTRVLLMARDANNLVSSNHVEVPFVSVCVANGNNGGNGLIQILYRRAAGTATQPDVQFFSGGIPAPAFGSNNWVRLQRVDNSFNAYWSTNGTDWNFILNITTNATSGLFPASVYVGLGVCSHNEFATTAAVVSDLGLTANPQPTLNVVASGANAMLNWSVDSSGYKVQSATNLAAPVWVNEAAATSAGSGQYQITVPVNVPAKFYRLLQK